MPVEIFGKLFSQDSRERFVRYKSKPTKNYGYPDNYFVRKVTVSNRRYNATFVKKKEKHRGTDIEPILDENPKAQELDVQSIHEEFARDLAPGGKLHDTRLSAQFKLVTKGMPRKVQVVEIDDEDDIPTQVRKTKHLNLENLLGPDCLDSAEININYFDRVEKEGDNGRTEISYELARRQNGYIFVGFAECQDLSKQKRELKQQLQLQGAGVQKSAISASLVQITADIAKIKNALNLRLDMRSIFHRSVRKAMIDLHCGEPGDFSQMKKPGFHRVAIDGNDEFYNLSRTASSNTIYDHFTAGVSFTIPVSGLSNDEAGPYIHRVHPTLYTHLNAEALTMLHGYIMYELEQLKKFRQMVQKSLCKGGWFSKPYLDKERARVIDAEIERNLVAHTHFLAEVIYEMKRRVETASHGCYYNENNKLQLCDETAMYTYAELRAIEFDAAHEWKSYEAVPAHTQSPTVQYAPEGGALSGKLKEGGAHVFNARFSMSSDDYIHFQLCIDDFIADKHVDTKAVVCPVTKKRISPFRPSRYNRVYTSNIHNSIIAGENASIARYRYAKLYNKSPAMKLLSCSYEFNFIVQFAGKEQDNPWSDESTRKKFLNRQGYFKLLTHGENPKFIFDRMYCEARKQYNDVVRENTSLFGRLKLLFSSRARKQFNQFRHDHDALFKKGNNELKDNIKRLKNDAIAEVRKQTMNALKEFWNDDGASEKQFDRVAKSLVYASALVRQSDSKDDQYIDIYEPFIAHMQSPSTDPEADFSPAKLKIYRKKIDIVSSAIANNEALRTANEALANQIKVVTESLEETLKICDGQYDFSKFATKNDMPNKREFEKFEKTVESIYAHNHSPAEAKDRAQQLLFRLVNTFLLTKVQKQIGLNSLAEGSQEKFSSQLSKADFDYGMVNFLFHCNQYQVDDEHFKGTRELAKTVYEYFKSLDNQTRGPTAAKLYLDNMMRRIVYAQLQNACLAEDEERKPIDDQINVFLPASVRGSASQKVTHNFSEEYIFQLANTIKLYGQVVQVPSGGYNEYTAAIEGRVYTRESDGKVEICYDLGYAQKIDDHIYGYVSGATSSHKKQHKRGGILAIYDFALFSKARGEQTASPAIIYKRPSYLCESAETQDLPSYQDQILPYDRELFDDRQNYKDLPDFQFRLVKVFSPDNTSKHIYAITAFKFYVLSRRFQAQNGLDYKFFSFGAQLTKGSSEIIENKLFYANEFFNSCLSLQGSDQPGHFKYEINVFLENFIDHKAFHIYTPGYLDLQFLRIALHFANDKVKQAIHKKVLSEFYEHHLHGEELELQQAQKNKFIDEYAKIFGEECAGQDFLVSCGNQHLENLLDSDMGMLSEMVESSDSKDEALLETVTSFNTSNTMLFSNFGNCSTYYTKSLRFVADVERVLHGKEPLAFTESDYKRLNFANIDSSREKCFEVFFTYKDVFGQCSNKLALLFIKFLARFTFKGRFFPESLTQLLCHTFSQNIYRPDGMSEEQYAASAYNRYKYLFTENYGSSGALEMQGYHDKFEQKYTIQVDNLALIKKLVQDYNYSDDMDEKRCEEVAKLQERSLGLFLTFITGLSSAEKSRVQDLLCMLNALYSTIITDLAMKAYQVNVLDEFALINRLQKLDEVTKAYETELKLLQEDEASHNQQNIEGIDNYKTMRKCLTDIRENVNDFILSVSFFGLGEDLIKSDEINDELDYAQLKLLDLFNSRIYANLNIKFAYAIKSFAASANSFTLIDLIVSKFYDEHDGLIVQLRKAFPFATGHIKAAEIFVKIIAQVKPGQPMPTAEEIKFLQRFTHFVKCTQHYFAGLANAETEEAANARQTLAFDIGQLYQLQIQRGEEGFVEDTEGVKCIMEEMAWPALQQLVVSNKPYAIDAGNELEFLLEKLIPEDGSYTSAVVVDRAKCCAVLASLIASEHPDVLEEKLEKVLARDSYENVTKQFQFVISNHDYPASVINSFKLSAQKMLLAHCNKLMQESFNLQFDQLFISCMRNDFANLAEILAVIFADAPPELVLAKQASLNALYFNLLLMADHLVSNLIAIFHEHNDDDDASKTKVNALSEKISKLFNFLSSLASICEYGMHFNQRKDFYRHRLALMQVNDVDPIHLTEAGSQELFSKHVLNEANFSDDSSAINCMGSDIRPFIARSFNPDECSMAVQRYCQDLQHTDYIQHRLRVYIHEIFAQSYLHLSFDEKKQLCRLSSNIAVDKPFSNAWAEVGFNVKGATATEELSFSYQLQQVDLLLSATWTEETAAKISQLLPKNFQHKLASFRLTKDIIEGAALSILFKFEGLNNFITKTLKSVALVDTEYSDNHRFALELVYFVKNANLYQARNIFKILQQKFKDQTVELKDFFVNFIAQYKLSLIDIFNDLSMHFQHSGQNYAFNLCALQNQGDNDPISFMISCLTVASSNTEYNSIYVEGYIELRDIHRRLHDEQGEQCVSADEIKQKFTELAKKPIFANLEKEDKVFFSNIDDGYDVAHCTAAIKKFMFAIEAAYLSSQSFLSQARLLLTQFIDEIVDHYEVREGTRNKRLYIKTGLTNRLLNEKPIVALLLFLKSQNNSVAQTFADEADVVFSEVVDDSKNLSDLMMHAHELIAVIDEMVLSHSLGKVVHTFHDDDTSVSSSDVDSIEGADLGLPDEAAPTRPRVKVSAEMIDTIKREHKMFAVMLDYPAQQNTPSAKYAELVRAIHDVKILRKKALNAAIHSLFNINDFAFSEVFRENDDFRAYTLGETSGSHEPMLPKIVDPLVSLQLDDINSYKNQVGVIAQSTKRHCAYVREKFQAEYISFFDDLKLYDDDKFDWKISRVLCCFDVLEAVVQESISQADITFQQSFLAKMKAVLEEILRALKKKFISIDVSDLRQVTKLLDLYKKLLLKTAQLFGIKNEDFLFDGVEDIAFLQQSVGSYQYMQLSVKRTLLEHALGNVKLREYVSNVHRFEAGKKFTLGNLQTCAFETVGFKELHNAVVDYCRYTLNINVTMQSNIMRNFENGSMTTSSVFETFFNRSVLNLHKYALVFHQLHGQYYVNAFEQLKAMLKSEFRFAFGDDNCREILSENNPIFAQYADACADAEAAHELELIIYIKCLVQRHYDFSAVIEKLQQFLPIVSANYDEALKEKSLSEDNYLALHRMVNVYYAMLSAHMQVQVPYRTDYVVDVKPALLFNNQSEATTKFVENVSAVFDFYCWKIAPLMEELTKLEAGLTAIDLSQSVAGVKDETNNIEVRLSEIRDYIAKLRDALQKLNRQAYVTFLAAVDTLYKYIVSNISQLKEIQSTEDKYIFVKKSMHNWSLFIINTEAIFKKDDLKALQLAAGDFCKRNLERVDLGGYPHDRADAHSVACLKDSVTYALYEAYPLSTRAAVSAMPKFQDETHLLSTMNLQKAFSAKHKNIAKFKLMKTFIESGVQENMSHFNCSEKHAIVLLIIKSQYDASLLTVGVEQANHYAAIFLDMLNSELGTVLRLCDKANLSFAEYGVVYRVLADYFPREIKRLRQKIQAASSYGAETEDANFLLWLQTNIGEPIQHLKKGIDKRMQVMPEQDLNLSCPFTAEHCRTLFAARCGATLVESNYAFQLLAGKRNMAHFENAHVYIRSVEAIRLMIRVFVHAFQVYYTTGLPTQKVIFERSLERCGFSDETLFTALLSIDEQRLESFLKTFLADNDSKLKARNGFLKGGEHQKRMQWFLKTAYFLVKFDAELKTSLTQLQNARQAEQNSVRNSVRALILQAKIYFEEQVHCFKQEHNSSTEQIGILDALTAGASSIIGKHVQVFAQYASCFSEVEMHEEVQETLIVPQLRNVDLSGMTLEKIKNIYNAYAKLKQRRNDSLTQQQQITLANFSSVDDVMNEVQVAAQELAELGVCTSRQLATFKSWVNLANQFSTATSEKTDSEIAKRKALEKSLSDKNICKDYFAERDKGKRANLRTNYLSLISRYEQLDSLIDSFQKTLALEEEAKEDVTKLMRAADGVAAESVPVYVKSALAFYEGCQQHDAELVKTNLIFNFSDNDYEQWRGNSTFGRTVTEESEISVDVMPQLEHFHRANIALQQSEVFKKIAELLSVTNGANLKDFLKWLETFYNVLEGLGEQSYQNRYIVLAHLTGEKGFTDYVSKIYSEELIPIKHLFENLAEVKQSVESIAINEDESEVYVTELRSSFIAEIAKVETILKNLEVRLQLYKQNMHAVLYKHSHAKALKSSASGKLLRCTAANVPLYRLPAKTHVFALSQHSEELNFAELAENVNSLDAYEAIISQCNRQLNVPGEVHSLRTKTQTHVYLAGLLSNLDECKKSCFKPFKKKLEADQQKAIDLRMVLLLHIAQRYLDAEPLQAYDQTETKSLLEFEERYWRNMVLVNSFTKPLSSIEGLWKEFKRNREEIRQNSANLGLGFGDSYCELVKSKYGKIKPISPKLPVNSSKQLTKMQAELKGKLASSTKLTRDLFSIYLERELLLISVDAKTAKMIAEKTKIEKFKKRMVQMQIFIENFANVFEANKTLWQQTFNEDGFTQLLLRLFTEFYKAAVLQGSEQTRERSESKASLDCENTAVEQSARQEFIENNATEILLGIHKHLVNRILGESVSVTQSEKLALFDLARKLLKHAQQVKINFASVKNRFDLTSEMTIEHQIKAACDFYDAWSKPDHAFSLHYAEDVFSRSQNKDTYQVTREQNEYAYVQSKYLAFKQMLDMKVATNELNQMFVDQCNIMFDKINKFLPQDAMTVAQACELSYVLVELFKDKNEVTTTRSLSTATYQHALMIFANSYLQEHSESTFDMFKRAIVEKYEKLVKFVGQNRALLNVDEVDDRYYVVMLTQLDKFVAQQSDDQAGKKKFTLLVDGFKQAFDAYRGRHALNSDKPNDFSLTHYFSAYCALSEDTSLVQIKIIEETIGDRIVEKEKLMIDETATQRAFDFVCAHLGAAKYTQHLNYENDLIRAFDDSVAPAYLCNHTFALQTPSRTEPYHGLFSGKQITKGLRLQTRDPLDDKMMHPLTAFSMFSWVVEAAHKFNGFMQSVHMSYVVKVASSYCQLFQRHTDQVLQAERVETSKKIKKAALKEKVREFRQLRDSQANITPTRSLAKPISNDGISPARASQPSAGGQTPSKYGSFSYASSSLNSEAGSYVGNASVTGTTKYSPGGSGK